MNDDQRPYGRIAFSGSNVSVFVCLSALYIVTFGCLWTLRDWPLLVNLIAMWRSFLIVNWRKGSGSPV
jgi:hypothetical protein